MQRRRHISALTNAPGSPTCSNVFFPEDVSVKPSREKVMLQEAQQTIELSKLDSTLLRWRPRHCPAPLGADRRSKLNGCITAVVPHGMTFVNHHSVPVYFEELAAAFD